MVYRALIRSIIDYGAVLYKSTSVSLLKKLNSIQCTALTLCVGAMKGTALSSLLRECDELPLFYRNTMLADKYLLKMYTPYPGGWQLPEWSFPECFLIGCW